MNSFKVLTTLAFLVVILGTAVIYSASLTQKVVEVEPINDVVVEEPTVKETLAPGTYLVYSVTRVSDPGAQEWANDDTQEVSFYRWRLGEAAPVKFYTNTHGPELDGGLTTSVFGKDLLMHRFALQDEKQQDGIVDLAGNVLKVKPQQWGIIRSKNGRFEVSYTSPYDNIGEDGYAIGDVTATVTNLETGATLATVDLSALPQERFFVEPFLIDDAGKYFYARELCGCEAQTSGLWEVEVATGAIRQLDTIVRLDNIGQATIDSERRRMMYTKTGYGEYPCEFAGMCRGSAPPTSVRVLDLETGIDRELFTDQDSAYGAPILDPTDPDRYLLVDGGEPQILSLRSLSDPTFKEEKTLDGTAYLTDFLGETVVYWMDEGRYLMDWESWETTLLGKAVLDLKEGSWQQFDYFGSITIE